MSFRVVIPARHGSSRLPGKPLVRLVGKSLVQHVYERARESAAAEIVIATDDERILDECRRFGADVELTSRRHRSGSDRLAEVTRIRGWPDDALVVNLQGDEPCIPGALVDQVAASLSERRDLGMATLAHPITTREALEDPHIVKVVTDARGLAGYFSRAPIPFDREGLARGEARLSDNVPFLRHIGLYAYRVGFLQRFVTWAPAPLELIESLEQLRALWHGHDIHVAIATTEPGPGVDTPADLAKASSWLAGRRNGSAG